MFNGKVITKVNTNNIVDNDIFDNNIFTNDEKITLDINIEQLISEYNDNREEINRLVFECVTEMTEGDKAELNLSKRNFFHRIIGEITGSNQNLQNKINSNHTAAQYAALEILQKLERKNLINFTLITAVNNKLNASIISKNKESKRIYSFLKDFIKKNRNRFYHYETRLDIAEQKINLLEWCNSIKYQEFNGEEYINMDNTKKIVCLVRDFYELTNGNWSFPDLLLLKTAMSDIKISPNSYVNYYTVLKEIHDKPLLKKKLFKNAIISPTDEFSHIIPLGVFNKLELLDTTESYIIDSALGCIDVKENEITRNDLRDNLTKKYISQSALVNINTKISIYNFIVELLYTLQQAEAEKILFLEQETTLHEAIDLYIHCHMNEAADKFLPLAESGNTKAMYLLGDIYRNYSSVEFHSIGESWQKKGAYLQDPLCMISTIPNEDDVLIMEDIIEKLKDLSYQNDMFAQYELGYCYEYGRCVEKDAELAKKWYLTAAKLGHFKSMNKLGLLYAADRDYIEANKWYKLAGENGYNEGWYNLGKSYHYGIGVEIDSDIAIYYYQKSFNLHGNCSGEIANQIGLVYHEIKKENEQANHWFKRAGELGYSYGWSNLASSYENGRGVSIDIEKAKEYYIKAYDIGDNSAGKFANSIGVIFANEKNYTSAYKWFHLAAKDGFGWGFYNLGCLFYHGLGVEKNNDIAIYYYEKTSYIDSLKMLGKIYSEKISVN